MTPISLQKAMTPLGCMVMLGLLQSAHSQTTTFEDHLVSGVPTSLPVWSGFSPVVLQYGEAVVQDTITGSGAQALELGSGSAVAWSPAAEPVSGEMAVTEFLVRHDTFSSAAPVIPAEELSSVIFINDTGLMALDGDSNGGGTWRTLLPLSAGTFYSVSIMSDHAAQTYDVAINGTVVADDFGFKDAITIDSYVATFETSEQTWLDDVFVTFESETTPPNPNPMTWASLPAPGQPGGASSDVLFTDFTGRTVNGATASNITWVTDGVADPGDLTAVGPGALAGLFTSAAAADRFIPNLNVDNEGSWSAAVPLTLTGPAFSLKEVQLDLQHVGNAGTIPTVNKSSSFTVRVSGSSSGLLDSVTIVHNVTANDGSGSDLFVFDPALPLDASQSYEVTIQAEGEGGGANVGLEALTLRNVGTSIVDTDTSIRMIATTATDTSGVEYYFEAISGGGHDSGWQDSPEYIDTGLTPGTSYTYRNRARDKSVSQNVTEWSTPATATTTGTPPSLSFAEWISSFGLDANEQGFGDDPDGDRLANGLESWLGTHPGEFTAGLTTLSSDGVTASFTHPQSVNPASDVSGYYEWSPNLIDWYDGDGVDGSLDGITVTFSANTIGTTTTVAITASEAWSELFLRVGVMQN